MRDLSKDGMKATKKWKPEVIGATKEQPRIGWCIRIVEGCCER